MPLKTSGVEDHRSLPHLPQTPPLASARRARMIVSWWDREIQVWRLYKTPGKLAESLEKGEDIDQNRKLLKSILVKGEDNIASATISQDGSLLVVATAKSLKCFFLVSSAAATGKDTMQVTTIDIPSRFSNTGANLVSISPDQNWLCLVNATQIRMVKIIPSTGPLVPPRLEDKIFTLKRLNRSSSQPQLGKTLARYDKSIAHVTFSPDSQMLASADLGGCIDTWVLSASQTNGTSALLSGGVRADDDAMSDSSSASDSDPPNGITTAGTQRGHAVWKPNPKADLLPALQEALTVLSFSDQRPGRASADSTGDGPANDYTLLAITRKWRIVALKPLAGKLAPWSKMTSVANYPDQLKTVRDLPKGVVWNGLKAWIYGISFLFMIDLARPFPPRSANAAAPGAGASGRGIKRKRGGDAGAGSASQRGGLGPTDLRGLDLRESTADVVPSWSKGDEAQQGGMSAGDRMEIDQADEEDGDDGSDGAEHDLALVPVQEPNGLEPKAHDGGHQSAPRPWFCTFKYRPILGIVPLGFRPRSTRGDPEDVTGPLEVALVERPHWDEKLPARYYEEKEWERRM